MVHGGVAGEKRANAGERAAFRPPLVVEVLAQLAHVCAADEAKVVTGKARVAIKVTGGRVETASNVAQLGEDGVAHVHGSSGRGDAPPLCMNCPARIQFGPSLRRESTDTSVVDVPPNCRRVNITPTFELPLEDALEPAGKDLGMLAAQGARPGFQESGGAIVDAKEADLPLPNFAGEPQARTADR